MADPADYAQIFQGYGGDYRYHIRARNNEIIAQGEGYEHKTDIEEMLAKHFPNVTIVDLSRLEEE